jgi:hypothetical protein
MTINISSSSSYLKDVASFASLSLFLKKSTPFLKISSLCGALHFQPFFILEARRLKLFVNCFVNATITLKCLYPYKVVLLSSLSLAYLFTSLFWGLSSKVKNYSVLVSSNIFFDFVFLAMFLANYIHYTYWVNIVKQDLLTLTSSF